MDNYSMVVLVIIAIYCALSLFIGIRVNKTGKGGLEEYYVGGRKMGPFVSYFTYVATFHSSFAFIGAAGWLYSRGISFFAVFTSCVVSPLMIYFIGRPVWYLGKKYNFMTQGDLLGSYFESRIVRLLVAVITLVFLVPYLQSQIMGGGYIFEAVTGGVVPFWMGSLILYVVMIGYVLLGGFRAVAWTDTVQGIIMIFAVFLSGGVVLGSVMGTLNWTSLSTVLIERMPEAVMIPVEYWPTYMTTFLSLFGISIYPPSFQRFYSVKNPKTLKWLAVTSPIYLIFFYIPIFVVAFAGRAFMPGVDNPDMILPIMMMTYAPAVLTGIVMAGAVAATMSSADSQLHVSSSIFTLDIYKTFINKKATEKQTLMVGRIVIVVFAGIALIMSQFANNLLVAIVAVALGGCLQIMPALIGALYWKGGTRAGMVAGLVTGVVVLLLTQFVIASPLGISSGFWGLVCNFAVFLVVSRFTEPVSEASRERFHGYLARVNRGEVRYDD